MDGLNRIGDHLAKGISQFKLTILVKGSMGNTEDKRNEEGMHSMEAINDYMKQRYMISPNLLKATLSGLEGRPIPSNRQQAADNIEATLAMVNLLNGVKIIGQIESTHLAMLESRCIMTGMRR